MKVTGTEGTVTVGKITVSFDFYSDISLFVCDEEGTKKGDVCNLTAEELNDLAEAIRRINSLNLNEK